MSSYSNSEKREQQAAPSLCTNTLSGESGTARSPALHLATTVRLHHNCIGTSRVNGSLPACFLSIPSQYLQSSIADNWELAALHKGSIDNLFQFY